MNNEDSPICCILYSYSEKNPPVNRKALITCGLHDLWVCMVKKRHQKVAAPLMITCVKWNLTWGPRPNSKVILSCSFCEFVKNVFQTLYNLRQSCQSCSYESSRPVGISSWQLSAVHWITNPWPFYQFTPLGMNQTINDVSDENCEGINWVDISLVWQIYTEGCHMWNNDKWCYDCRFLWQNENE